MGRRKPKKLTDLFSMTYNGYYEMLRRHPKAAKKRRVRKKWRKRYPVNILDINIDETSSPIQMVLDNYNWSCGGTVDLIFTPPDHV